MIEIIGWIGLVTMILAYMLLNSKKSNRFLTLQIISCSLLLIYSVWIEDYVFISVNGFAVIMLIIKSKNGGIESKGGLK